MLGQCNREKEIVETNELEMDEAIQRVQDRVTMVGEKEVE